MAKRVLFIMISLIFVFMIGNSFANNGINTQEENKNVIVAAGGKEGILIFAAFNIENPIQLGQLDTAGLVYDVESLGNYVYVADGKNGLW